jgi:hypothetical protein
MGLLPVTLWSRFWQKVDRSAGPDGHWLWTGARCKNGYPKIRDGRRFLLAHRVSLAWQTGNAGVGLDACHDDAKGCPRHCVNPAHLTWKSHRDNMIDVINKHGRLCPSTRKIAERPLFESVPF